MCPESYSRAEQGQGEGLGPKVFIDGSIFPLPKAFSWTPSTSPPSWASLFVHRGHPQPRRPGFSLKPLPPEAETKGPLDQRLEVGRRKTISLGHKLCLPL